MRANVLLHDKKTALEIAKMRLDNSYTETALLQGLPDYVFGEAFEAILGYDKYDNKQYNWFVDEGELTGWIIDPIFVQRVEVLDV